MEDRGVCRPRARFIDLPGPLLCSKMLHFLLGCGPRRVRKRCVSVSWDNEEGPLLNALGTCDKLGLATRYPAVWLKPMFPPMYTHVSNAKHHDLPSGLSSYLHV